MLIAFSRLGMLSLFVLACLSMQPSSQAQERLTATTVQDEPRKIPEDNIAYFNRADRKVRFQLVKMSGLEDQTLAGTKLTVIDSAGAEKSVVADKAGVATLNDAEPGLHALVVVGDEGHVAVPIALREEAPSDDPASAPMPSMVKLAVTSIDPRDAVEFTTAYLPPEPTGSPEDIDSDLVSTGSAVPSLQYRIRLSSEGALSGQVYSLVRDGLSTSGVGNTNLAIYRGNQLVARPVADETGKFSVPNLAPGYYGILAAGAGGYAAFGFEAYDATTLASSQSQNQTFVSTRNDNLTFVNTQAGGSDTLPVVLVPPSMLPGILDAIRAAGLSTAPDGFAGVPGAGSPMSGVGPGAGGGVGGSGAGGGVGAGGGGGFGAAGGGLGGAGALGLLAAGGAAAAIAASGDDNENNFVPPVVSPATVD
jgi:hypothetical protein